MNTPRRERLFSGIQRDAAWRIGDFKGNMPEGLVKQIKQLDANGEKLGRVEVYLSPRFKNAELARNTLNAIIALVVLDLGIIAVLWLMLRSILINPITHLSDVAEKISLGNFGQKLQFNTRNDEIGLLARAWNRLDSVEFIQLLADDAVYESQWVFTPLEGNEAIADYLTGKMETIKAAGKNVRAELTTARCGYKYGKPCVVLKQGDNRDTDSVMVFEVDGARITRCDLCAPQLYDPEPTDIYPA